MSKGVAMGQLACPGRSTGNLHYTSGGGRDAENSLSNRIFGEACGTEEEGAELSGIRSSDN